MESVRQILRRGPLGRRFESLMCEVSTRFIDISVDEIDSALEDAQCLMCEGLGLDRCILWQASAEQTGVLRLTHVYQSAQQYYITKAPSRAMQEDPEWVFRGKGIPLLHRGMDADAFLPWIHERVRRGEKVIIRSLDQLPPQAAEDLRVLRCYGTLSTIALPLQIGVKQLGCVAFDSTRCERSWTPEEVDRFEMISHVFCHALERKTLELHIMERKKAEEAARELSGRFIHAQERERARVARELHDDIVQQLACVAIDVGKIQFSGSLGAVAEEQLERVRSDLVRLGNDIHALSYELHPSIVADLGLIEALRAECEKLTKRGTIAARFSVRDVPALIPIDQSICLFRIAQEALRNAVKHGRAGRAQVSLWGCDGGIQLVIHDNGVGFDPKEHRSNHSLGLASMRERARLVSGVLEVDSKPDGGTTVVAWVPLPGERAR